MKTECRDTEAFMKNWKKLALEEGENKYFVTYFQWQSMDKESIINGEKKTFKISKIAMTTKVREMRKALAEEIPIIKPHLYGIYNYNKQKRVKKTQAHAVWAHIKPILRKIFENKKIYTLHFYSDGPTSQYRNRTNIYFLLSTLTDEFKQIIKSKWTFTKPGRILALFTGAQSHREL